MANDILYGEVGAEQPRADYAHFTPNFELIGKVLDTKQKKYDTNLMMLSKVKAKTDEVNSLEGYDRDRWLTKQQGYDDKVNQIMRLYDGDLGKADSELNSFVFDMSRDFGTHGEATAINARHAGYTADEKELSKRRAENKITEGQYQMLGRELRNTAATGIGTDKGNWNQWNRVNPTDKVDVEKFMNDFVKNKKEELRQQWGEGRPNPVTGKIEYRAGEHEFITEESIQAEGMKALHNKMQETGQLKADYMWHLESTNSKPTASNHIAELGKTKDIYSNNIQALNTLKGVDLQTKINEIYKQMSGTNKDALTVDGKEGDATLKAKTYLLEQLQQGHGNLISQIDKMSNFTDEEVNAFHYGDWQNKYVGDLVKPWAGAVSYDKYRTDLKTADNPHLDFYYKMKLQNHQASLNKDQVLFEYKLENPIVPPIKFKAEGYTETSSITGMADVTKHNEEKANNGMMLTKDLLHAVTNGLPTSMEEVKALSLKLKDLSPQDIAKTINDAEFKQVGNNVEINFKTFDKDGNVTYQRQVIPNTNISRFNDIIGRAKTQVKQDNIVQARVDNATDEVLNEGGFDNPEFVSYMKDKKEFEVKYKPALSDAHELYKNNINDQIKGLDYQINQIDKLGREGKTTSSMLETRRNLIGTKTNLLNARSISLDNFTQKLSQDANFSKSLPAATDPQSKLAIDKAKEYSNTKLALQNDQNRFNAELERKLYDTRETAVSMNMTNEIFGYGSLPLKIVQLHEKAMNDQVSNQANWSSMYGFQSTSNIKDGNYLQGNFANTVEAAKQKLIIGLTAAGRNDIKPENIEVVTTALGGGDVKLGNGENAYGIKVAFRDKSNGSIIGSTNGANSSFTFYMPQSQIMTSMFDRSQTFIYNNAFEPFVNPIQQGVNKATVQVEMENNKGEPVMVDVKYNLGNSSANKSNNPNQPNMPAMVTYNSPLDGREITTNFNHFFPSVAVPLAIKKHWSNQIDQTNFWSMLGNDVDITDAKNKLLKAIVVGVNPETGYLNPNADYNEFVNNLMSVRAKDKYGRPIPFVTRDLIDNLFPEIHSNGTRHSTVKGRIYEFPNE
jgi:hypothetical protein